MTDLYKRHRKKPWTSLATASEQIVTLPEFFTEFKTNFGAMVALDLADDSGETRHTVHLTEKERTQIRNGTHRCVRMSDVPTLSSTTFKDGVAEVPLITWRLQQALDDYAQQMLPLLIDAKQIMISVDYARISELEDEIFNTLHDYIALGMTDKKLDPPNTPRLTNMLEQAWGDAVEFYRPKLRKNDTSTMERS